MIEYLKKLLEDLQNKEESYCKNNFEHYHQKSFALETAIDIIDILEKMKNERN